MITYEASLICDTCKEFIGGSVATHPMHARRAAIEAGLKRGWRVGAVGLRPMKVTCKTCLDKAQGPGHGNYRLKTP